MKGKKVITNFSRIKEAIFGTLSKRIGKVLTGNLILPKSALLGLDIIAATTDVFYTSRLAAKNKIGVPVKIKNADLKVLRSLMSDAGVSVNMKRKAMQRSWQAPSSHW